MHTTRPIIVGTGIGRARQKPRRNFGRKKTARHARGTAGEILFNAHQLGTLVISDPDLLRSIVTDAEVKAFKEI